MHNCMGTREAWIDRCQHHMGGHEFGHCGPEHHGAGARFSSFFGGGHGYIRRFLKPVILLLLAEEPTHGYEMMGKLKEFGIDPSNMDPSILYRLLRSIENEGLAESSLNDSGSGPARKVYTLTPEGREVLDLWAASIEGTVSFLTGVKERYEKLGK